MDQSVARVLPSFLKPLHRSHVKICVSDYEDAIFQHPQPIGAVHAQWWPSVEDVPSKVVLFIPGNPGLLDFYVPFLSALHAKDHRMAILAHSHAGHTPGLSASPGCHQLLLQIQSAIEAFDGIKAEYGPNIPVIVVGHSIGSWVTLQILKARSTAISGIFLLFPTITDIASSPNGRALSWVFPWATMISRISNILRILPLPSLLSWIFRSWPARQRTVLEGLLRSPPSILATLSMADDEMKLVRGLDTQLLQQNSYKIWMYFAQSDDWVGDSKNVILHSFQLDQNSVRVVHGHHGIPHAYCIEHGEQLADQCFEWLKALASVGKMVRSLSPPPLSVVADGANKTHSQPSYSNLDWHIDIPVLAPEVQSTYRPLSEVPINLQGQQLFKLDEIIGEYEIDNVLYYYARWQQGIASRFPAEGLREHLPEVVASYLKRKRRGDFEDFDPSGKDVHPTSRLRDIVTVNRHKVSASYSMISGSSSRSNLDEASDEEIEDSDDEYGQNVRPPRRILRARAAKSLPFSPRKTRTQATARDSSLDNDWKSAESEEDQPKRRSTRTRKTRGFDMANYEDSDAMDVDSGSEAPRSSRLKKKPKRGKASRPAYGSFRSVEDLDYDPCSDEETAPLRKHRDFCEKCHRQPSHILLNSLKRKKTKGKRKRKDDDLEEDSGDEEEKLTQLGGWVRCLKCPISVHWRCLSSAQRDEILKAARERDREEWRSTQVHDDVYDEHGQPKPHPDEPKKRPGLEPHQITEFICSSCMKGGICMGCMDTALETDPSLNKSTHDGTQTQDTKSVVDEDVNMEDASKAVTKLADQGISDRLLFRCVLCKRLAHYEHLARPPDLDADASVVDVATWLQREQWRCADCLSFQDKVEHVLAWRPYPPNAVEPPRPSDEPPNAKASLPREYLVKWVDRSYKRVQWVPHMWLASTHFSKLKNFLASGTKVDLLQEPFGVGEPTEEDQKMDGPSALKTPAESRASSSKPGTDQHTSSPGHLVNAEQYIPPLWSTVDRVLDLVIWSPMYLRHVQNSRTKKSRRRLVKSGDDDDDDGGNGEENEESLAAFNEVFKHGNNPPEKDSETLEEWEERTGQTFSMDDIQRVVFGFFKWSDLGYDDATWDSPPRPEDASWPAFVNAVKRFIAARTVFIKKGTKSVLDRSSKSWEHNGYMKQHRDDVKTLDIGQDPSLKLMDFQQDGFNWLCNNWWNGQHCILADEMGKTVQIASFLGHIIDQFDASPALVVVPNSTLPNWVREFERWAPNLRVVPWYGEARARDVIRKYELFHKDVNSNRYTDAKFHVLVTTYEAVISPKDFGPIFKKQPRWEVLIVDEGQRLKSDASLLFRKLTELNTIHRIIMTGTPLNNNIRELFNLMNFLDPIEWNDLEALEKEYAELTDELVKELHTKLRPYFLRRIKSEVLELPPKNEVIVPVSMTPLQKEIYRSILSHNLDILKGLTVNGPSAAVSAKKSRLTNLLMEMRKCLQHPYIYASDIEPPNLTPQATHEKLIDASAKFRLLKQLLPRLKARGHRVLLFSQFVIALDVIEDFVVGEGYKCLRLDGNTKSRDRQKNMDEFNKPDSEYFIFLLSTRAGGVGINLYSADTVIIFDPDFNPHQAIARSHRFGQQKTVLVFKLMVKDSAEERIMQMGKKKLALEHLIVKKMEDDDSAGEDIHSILTYGARALFDDSEGASKDVIYSDADIDKLIERTEKETQVVEKKPEGGLSFEFAKIWSADKDSLEEVQEADGNDNSWSLTLQKIAAEQASTRVTVKASGRGVRRKATNVAGPDAYRENPPTPVKSKKKASKASSEGSDYGAAISSVSVSSSSSDDDGIETTYEEPKKTEGKKRKAKTRSPRPSTSQHVPYAADEVCSLCHTNHSSSGGECGMTRNSQDLVAFRSALMTGDDGDDTEDDDDIEARRAAIKAIDETLARRGEVHLIYGQPLVPLDKRPAQYPNTNPPPTSHHPAVPTIQYGTNAPAPAVAPAIPAYHTSVFPSTSPIMLQHPGPSRHKPKKHKQPFQCPVCDQQTYHLVKDCPVVGYGSHRIALEIARLDKDPTKAGVVDILRTIYARSVKSEKALGNPSA
ncbi:AB hydrolase superfamily protein [Pleurotus pulmonarius]